LTTFHDGYTTVTYIGYLYSYIVIDIVEHPLCLTDE